MALAVTGSLALTPTASAEAINPAPNSAASASPDEKTTLGSVHITKEDPAGTRLAGTAFLLLDATGQEAASGTTDAQGQLTLAELPAGVYRLRETSSGSPLHDTVPDQDVIITPGGTTRLTIVAPFKQAHLLLQVKDDKTGKLLSGARVNIGSSGTTLLTLTTGPRGTASGDLPITSLTTRFWAKQVKAPAGYQLPKISKNFTAGPAAQVSVTFSDSKIPARPQPPTGGNPSSEPTDTVTNGKDTDSVALDSGRSSGQPESSPAPAGSAPEAGTKAAPRGTLAHTGADRSRWLLGGATGLLVAGAGAILAARRRRPHDAA
ncbi:hypothetical protein HW445_03060 [Streptomyces sp. UH6]|nr:hypothetical protein [Streptomyces sp. UH6]